MKDVLVWLGLVVVAVVAFFGILMGVVWVFSESAASRAVRLQNEAKALELNLPAGCYLRDYGKYDGIRILQIECRDKFTVSENHYWTEQNGKITNHKQSLMFQWVNK